MANTSVFDRLRRLFSTDVVIRNVGGNQVKTIDSGHIQSSGEYETNALVDRFNRVYSTAPTSLYGAQFNLNYQYLRTHLYSEYDVMDQDAIIASALDIIADESTLKNDMGEVLQIRSSSEDVQKILYNLFYDVLNIEFNLWMWVRQMCKYGDFFLKLEIAEKFGVYNVIPYTAYHIERVEGQNPENPAEVKYRWNPDGFAGSSYGYYNVPNQGSNPNDDNSGITYDNYEMAHFRMVADVNYLPYGRSYIEPARKLYKQYSLMEDAMLIHRIARTIDRIQRIILSELNKIALVHLYTQGYTDESLTNFELSMQTPSIIFEQEKIELLKSKSELAGSLIEQGLVPSDWIYHNVYHFSEDQYDEYRDLVREDAKRQFRIDQIKAEGNDPVSTGKSYGTPHDLASLYGMGRMQSDPANVPDGYAGDDPKLGRPQDSITSRGKQDNNFGKDPLGTKRMKDTDKNDGDGRPKIREFESPKVTLMKNKDLFKNLPKKQMVFEGDKDDSSLLDESQLRS